MLVLTRKPGESVTIGDDIKISVIDVKGRQVRIGVEAPDNLSIHREEIYAKIQEENRQAVSVKDVDMEKLAKILPKIKSQADLKKGETEK